MYKCNHRLTLQIMLVKKTLSLTVLVRTLQGAHPTKSPLEPK